MADHVVGDQRERNAVFVKLPGGEARALQIRTRFGDEHFERAAVFDGHANHAERGTDAGGGERAGIALRHHAAVVRHQLGAEFADGAIGGAALFVDQQSFSDERGFDVGDLRGGIAFAGCIVRQFVEAAAEASDGPEEIDGGGPRFGERVA